MYSSTAQNKFYNTTVIPKDLYIIWYVGIVLILVVQYSGLDDLLATQLYQLTDQWQMRYQWFFRNIMHLGGRYLMVSIGLTSLILILLNNTTRSNLLSKLKLNNLLPNERVYFIGIFFSILICTLLIGALKKINPLTCPYKLLSYGGSMQQYYLLDFFSSSLPSGKCFPSGHSGSGFSLFALYFCTNLVKREFSTKLLLPGLVLGTVFGITQQIRGAHFLSHDIASIVICWTVCLLLPHFFQIYKLKKVAKHETISA